MSGNGVDDGTRHDFPARHNVQYLGKPLPSLACGPGLVDGVLVARPRFRRGDRGARARPPADPGDGPTTDAEAAVKALAHFEDGEWGRKYAAIGQSWRRACSQVAPFFAFHEKIRRIVCTTNQIEALNSRLPRAVIARGLP